MGCCLSKKDPSCSSSPPSIQNPNPNQNPHSKPVAQVELKLKKIAAVEADQREEKESTEEREKVEEKSAEAGQTAKKKEVFVIQHRKSNDKRPGAPDSDGSASNSSNSTDPVRESGKRSDPSSGIGSNILAAAASGQAVRTSSCTKEEVDAILIQCGRLSRSSSGKGNNGNGKRYCGSKRSYDFERENEICGEVAFEISNSGDGEEDERSRRRQSRGSHRRRTTPSRSRERGDQQQQQRSGSRERGERSSSNGRRVSRSPGRRGESPMSSNNNGNSNSNSSGNGNGNVKPGKLVSVPATVTSLTVDKGNNGNGSGNGGVGGNVKRVLVKRNVGSPRSQSPARADQASGNRNGNGGNQSQQPSLSRNGSRKAEHSPYRRTPLNEIDMNSLPFQPLPNKRPTNKGKEIEDDVVVVVKQPLNSASQNKYSESNNVKAGAQGTHRRTRSRGAEGYEVAKTNYCRVNELQTPNVEQMTEHKGEQVSPSAYDAMVTPVIFTGNDTLKLPQTLMRSRSSRRSRDLDINVDALLTPNPVTSYNSLLLQDIQNFHQKTNSNTNANANANASTSNNSTNTPFTLPPCVTKACSILEAVADLNSSTGLADNRRVSPRATAETTGVNKSESNFSSNQGRKRLETKDHPPFVVESEVKGGDDLMEPSLHKYVTVRKRGGDLDDEESSGSNSYVGVGGGGGNHQNWLSSSSWEPNSADSTDCWTSKSYTREDGFSPMGFQRHAISDFVGCRITDEGTERKIGAATRMQ